VTRFQALAARDFATRHRVADYCRDLGTTRKTLAVACRREVHATPHEVIRRRVLLEARRLLAFTELSVSQVASQLGFTDGAHFARVFRAAEHRTPRAFRDGR
jgi:AraC-like DNA-binding protein